MPVKFGQTSIRFWFFLSYLSNYYCKDCNISSDFVCSNIRQVSGVQLTPKRNSIVRLHRFWSFTFLAEKKVKQKFRYTYILVIWRRQDVNWNVGRTSHGSSKHGNSCAMAVALNLGIKFKHNLVHTLHFSFVVVTLLT